MSGSPTSGETENLIATLAQDLRPVRRLARPGWRAVWWLGIVAAIGIALAGSADLPAVAARLSAHPDMWLSVAGSVSTAILAAIAAMRLALPDRSLAWAALPTPGVVLWVAA